MDTHFTDTNLIVSKADEVKNPLTRYNTSGTRLKMKLTGYPNRVFGESASPSSKWVQTPLRFRNF